MRMKLSAHQARKVELLDRIRYLLCNNHSTLLRSYRLHVQESHSGIAGDAVERKAFTG